ncbi:MAG: DUF4369 domain-containing protein [Prevotella sp.]|nr:DUF4369 domain-containing protein [Prevotella sp.]
MRLLIAAMLAPIVLCGCAEQFNIEGTSSVPSLDGSKLYLQAVKGEQMVSIDSCEVVHGEFRFAGLLDTVRMASITVGDSHLMPLVLEEGKITVGISQPTMKLGGTPMNDLLYDFMTKHTQIENSMNELGHRENQMLLDGIDEQTIARQVQLEAAVLTRQEDSLVTNFICDNFDNVLGPGIFMMLTSGYRYPILTPQIEQIMSKATESFKQDAYVREYMRMARENEARLMGDDSGLPTDSLSQ